MDAAPALLEDDATGCGFVSAEDALWSAVLARLLIDAGAYWRGVDVLQGSKPHELEAAFDDVCRAGPMTRWCCGHSGHDAEWITECFLRQCEATTTV